MLDRAMQVLFLLALEPVSETTADHNSYGFRPERCTADAIAQVFTCLSKPTSARWVLEGDIKGCFDNISHEWLIRHIPMDRRILKKWLKAGYMDKGLLYTTDAGTPQGGIISPVLANMCLDTLEQKLIERFGSKVSLKGKKHKVNYIRYADDFICSGHSRELLENEVKPLIEEFMSERGLQLSGEKTAITHVEEGFDFLGQNIRMYGKTLLIKPANKNLRSFLHKARNLIEKNKTATAAGLIRLLNSVIRGWVNYHRHIVAKATFAYVDSQIWLKIWQWCKRRHPNKGKRWIKRKYFKSVGNRNWIFSGQNEDGETVSLIRADATPIKRHIKIKGKARLYLPEWEPYFERRMDHNWNIALWGRKKVAALWKRQNALCSACGQRITHMTGWNVHHRQMKCAGSGDEMSNLVLLHPDCHRQLHSSAAGCSPEQLTEA